MTTHHAVTTTKAFVLVPSFPNAIQGIIPSLLFASPPTLAGYSGHLDLYIALEQYIGVSCNVREEVKTCSPPILNRHPQSRTISYRSTQPMRIRCRICRQHASATSRNQQTCRRPLGTLAVRYAIPPPCISWQSQRRSGVRLGVYRPYALGWRRCLALAMGLRYKSRLAVGLGTEPENLDRKPYRGDRSLAPPALRHRIGSLGDGWRIQWELDGVR